MIKRLRIILIACQESTYLISSLLTNAEAWYNVTQADKEILDENLLRRIL